MKQHATTGALQHFVSRWINLELIVLQMTVAPNTKNLKPSLAQHPVIHMHVGKLMQ